MRRIIIYCGRRAPQIRKSLHQSVSLYAPWPHWSWGERQPGTLQLYLWVWERWQITFHTNIGIAFTRNSLSGGLITNESWIIVALRHAWSVFFLNLNRVFKFTCQFWTSSAEFPSSCETLISLRYWQNNDFSVSFKTWSCGNSVDDCYFICMVK